MDAALQERLRSPTIFSSVIFFWGGGVLGVSFMSGGEWSHYCILFTPSSLGAQNKSPLNHSNKAGLRKNSKAGTCGGYLPLPSLMEPVLGPATLNTNPGGQ